MTTKFDVCDRVEMTIQGKVTCLTVIDGKEEYVIEVADGVDANTGEKVFLHFGIDVINRCKVHKIETVKNKYIPPDPLLRSSATLFNCRCSDAIPSHEDTIIDKP